MARGVPKNGFRMTKNRMAQMASATPVATLPFKSSETIAQIEAKLADRFEALEIMSEATGRGINRALIVSGPAGLGKSFTIESKMAMLEREGHGVQTIKGYIRPLALYRLLYNARFSNSVIVFDDADSIFSDDVSMNLLKAACDSTETRRLSWMSESVTRLTDEDGESIPETFEFDGSVIFITNYDFDAMIDKGSKMAPHFQAMVSRSHYLDLAMKTVDDYVVRIKQVVKAGMLREAGFTQADEDIIINFISDNKHQLRELSLRMVIKLSTLMRMNRDNWVKLAKQTCFRNAA
jgi:hypothetical protein